jgi:hypothetical protein
VWCYEQARAVSHYVLARLDGGWRTAQIQLVYCSLTTAIAVLLSVEIGAPVLVGAQVIAE